MQRVLVKVARYGIYQTFRAPSSFKTFSKPLHRVIKPVSKVILLTAPFVFIAKRLPFPTTVTARETKMEDTLKQSDALYMQNKLKEAYEFLLPHKDVENADLQWKFARTCYRMGKIEGNSSDARKFADEAMAHIDRAVEIDPNSFNGQKWRGIILSWYCDFEGYKKKIERSYEIKQNFDAACKLDPSDPTARHLLGRWYYNVADVPWYMKSAAKYILAELPSATYEDALRIFQEAEDIQAGFFSQNWLYIGKCYYNLKKRDEAKEWLTKAASVTPKNQDDKEAKQEAQELLKKV